VRSPTVHNPYYCRTVDAYTCAHLFPPLLTCFSTLAYLPLHTCCSCTQTRTIAQPARQPAAARATYTQQQPWRAAAARWVQPARPVAACQLVRSPAAGANCRGSLWVLHTGQVAVLAGMQKCMRLMSMGGSGRVRTCSSTAASSQRAAAGA
jgi:hypothetical protein